MEKQSKVKTRRKFIHPLFHVQTKNENDKFFTKAFLKTVRQTGQLKLSGQHLSCVPEKMFKMYESDSGDGDAVNLNFGHTSKEDDEVWWNYKPLVHLDLSSNVLTEIPGEIGMFQDLSVLNLQDNNLTTLPKEIGNLTKITKLNLNHNKINELPNEFGKLKELRFLSLNHNCLEVVSEDFVDLVMLEKLDLSNNLIKKLPPGVGFLVRLTELNLSNNKLIELPLDIVNLRDLIKLDVSHNNLKTLPDKMGELRKLQFFYAQHNDIDGIPDFEGCTNVQELYFGNNFIKEFPEDFCNQMAHLKILELRDNQIEAVPDDIINITHLTKLDLTNNELTSLPNKLGIMPHLNNLKVEGNKLRQIRADIIRAGTDRILKHLREKMENCGEVVATIPVVGQICLDNIQFPDRYTMRNSNMLNLTMKNLTSIPDEVFVEAKEANVNAVDLCKNKLLEVPSGITILSDFLTELNLSVNQLKEIPDCLSLCTKLKFCDFSNNLLTTLPESLKSLIYLRELVLSYNRIITIPECIYEMVGLEILLLSDNNINEINVDCLKNVKRLAVLSLANNNIGHVPPELGNMTQLRMLELKGNSFRQPRYAILEQGTETILSYLRDRIPV